MSSLTKTIERFDPISVQLPRWFLGGDPTGLADFCGWSVHLEDETDWRWKIQTVETVRGTRPDLLRLRYLCASGVAQSASLYDPLLDLASRDELQPGGVWRAALAQDQRFAASEVRMFATTLSNIRALIMAAPTAAELRALMPQLAETRIRPALPRSSTWLIDMPNDWLSKRFGLARALLRDDRTPPRSEAPGTIFRSSQRLFDDAILGLSAYFTPLFTSLTPHVWGFAATRVGGLVALDFGQFIDGDQGASDRLLTRLSSRAGQRAAADDSPALQRTAFGLTLRWWCERLNLLFAQATNVANYVTRDGRFSPAMHMEKLLSLEQFFRHCESLATARDDEHSKRVVLFAALETLSGLAPRLGSDTTYDFNKVEKMLDQLKQALPKSVQTILLPRAERAVGALRGVLEGFFISDRHDSSGNILLIGDDGTMRPVRPNVAVRLWLRMLRNSQHGFDREQSRQTRDLLAIHDGSVPEALSDLAWFFLVYLLAFPEAIRRARPTSATS